MLCALHATYPISFLRGMEPVSLSFREQNCCQETAANRLGCLMEKVILRLPKICGKKKSCIICIYNFNMLHVWNHLKTEWKGTAVQLAIQSSPWCFRIQESYVFHCFGASLCRCDLLFFWPRFSHVTHCAWQVRQNQWWHTTGACHVSTTGWFVINSSQPDSWGWCLWYIQNQTKTCRMFHGNVSHPWTDAKKTQPAKAARTTSSMVCSSHIHLGQTPVTIQQTPVLRMGRNGQFVKN